MAQRSACWSGVADRCGGVYGSCTAGSLIVGERPAVADDAPTGGQGGVRWRFRHRGRRTTAAKWLDGRL